MHEKCDNTVVSLRTFIARSAFAAIETMAVHTSGVILATVVQALIYLQQKISNSRMITRQQDHMVVAIFVAEYIIWLLVLQLSPRITQSLPGATIFMLLTHHVIPVETLLLSCRLVYPEKLMFCLWDWLLTSTSHRSPVSPGGHRHVKPLSPSTHVALLCAHGDDAHSSMLTSQASPEKNSRNETELRKRKKYQV